MRAPGPAQRLRLLSAWGWLRVFVCPLCTCLVPVVAEQRHAAVHRAEARRGRPE